MRLIDVVKENPGLWNWSALSSNPNITLNDIENNPTFPWAWDTIAWNPNIASQEGWEFVQKYIEKIWSWNGLSTMIPLNIINTNLNYPWQWTNMASNPTLSDDFVIQNLNKPWGWDSLVMYMPLDFIEMHELLLREKLDKGGDENSFDYFLSLNSNVDLDYVLATPHFDWDWTNFSLHGDITIQDVVKNPTLDWVWQFLSQRFDVLDIIKHKDLSNADGSWEWDAISAKNPTVTMQIVKEHPECKWNMELLQRNPGITMNDIEKMPNKIWRVISLNDRLTINFYKQYVDQLNDYSYNLSKNLWNLKMTQKRKELLEQTKALSSFHVFPLHVIEEITSYTMGTPSIVLWEKMKIIESVLKRNPL